MTRVVLARTAPSSSEDKDERSAGVDVIEQRGACFTTTGFAVLVETGGERVVYSRCGPSATLDLVDWVGPAQGVNGDPVLFKYVQGGIATFGRMRGGA